MRTCSNPECPRPNPQGPAEFYLDRRGRPRPICRTCHKAQTVRRLRERRASPEGPALRQRHAELEAARRAQLREHPTIWGWGAEEQRKHDGSTAKANARARLRLLAATVETVDAREVYGRAGGLCGICGLPVPESNWHLDHIIPLSRGGEHSYANVRVAHPRCNGRKGSRLDSELPAVAV